MQQLLNHCRVGKISVHPENWQAKNASAKNYWYVSYRFYDDNLHQKKQVMIQGMNHLTDLIERQTATRAIIENEIANLRKGFNPITGKFYTVPESGNSSSIVSPKTKFCDALKKANVSLKLEDSTKTDMEWVLKHIVEAAPKVCVDDEFLDDAPIYNIKKRHIRALFDYLSEKHKWSNHAWNKHRSYLMMLFEELKEYDAVESNIIRDISKKKVVKKIRVILSEEERKKVREYLIEHNYRFWLFTNMFFHSGGRIKEFYRMRVGDVDLNRQTLKVTILKGKQYVEVIKPIKDIAVPYWKEYLQGYVDEKKDWWIVGEELYPQKDKPIRYAQINHRWRRIKIKLGITADFYSLKHLNSDQMAEQIGIQYAQKLNSHTSEATTRIYTVNQQTREMEAIKHIANEF